MSSGQCLKRAALGCSLRPASSSLPRSVVAGSRSAARSANTLRSLSTSTIARSSTLLSSQARYGLPGRETRMKAHSKIGHHLIFFALRISLLFSRATMVRNYGSQIRQGTNSSEADKIVKVPEMAESITEGTLKQFSKRTFGCCEYSYEHILTSHRGRRLR